MSTYTTQVTVLEAQAARSPQGIDPCLVKAFVDMCHKLKQTAFETVVREELIQQYAGAHHIAVSQADFDAAWTGIIKSKFHGQLLIAKYYAKGMHISLADLQAFAREDLLQQEVMFRVTQRMTLYAREVRVSRISVATQRELETVNALLKSGHPFNQIAQQLAVDRRSLCGQGACGEVGWYPVAFVPAAQHAIVTARVGQIVGPFPGQGGLGLVLVEGHDAHRLMNATQQLNMRQLLFARWLTDQERHASVQRYAST